MSLNAQERKQTSTELKANLELSELTVEGIAADLDLTSGEVERALEVESARPAHVWLLRDHLEAAVRARGVEPHPYSVLTEGMRAAASRWFGIPRT